MKATLTGFLIVVAIMIGSASLLLFTEAKISPRLKSAPESDEQSADLSHTPASQAAVRLSKALQLQSGIVTERLVQTTYRPEMPAYGKVLDLKPLLELRARHSQALAERDIALAALSESQKTYARLKNLHRDQIASVRNLQSARSQWIADKARVEAGRRRVWEIREEAAQSWGEKLVKWALDEPLDRLAPFINRRQALLLIALDAQQTLPDETSFVFIERNGERHKARKAYLISAAPHTDALAQGETYFFQAVSSKLRTGMRLSVWIPQTGQAISGINIPLAAIIWHSGHPWVYVQADQELFVRRSIADHHEKGDGWFVSEGFSPGEKVVITGGQMLLSEEFRWRIPEEDDD